ncbi:MULTISPECIES: hypothetical protein [unclassified Ruegeria]|uniref:hypothetical protein n=1 Tax=unclassified Ruegeria TaxID=2625375 RepID=UPI001492F7DF|nr:MULTISPECIES: hypothetical protein [unclassified Ruegeria]NOD88367.1 hypothetical protein [Ruegeria sp. HKCCD4318]NOE13276.1 hypothetical protein [Ruegeria sp. HKCCD4318-2]NOG11182.1 hypothetical protein [Ruegeria sp. HKCCD4315]
MGHDVRNSLPPEGQEIFDSLSGGARALFSLAGEYVFENLDDPAVSTLPVSDCKKILKLREIYNKSKNQRSTQPTPPFWLSAIILTFMALALYWFFGSSQ